MQGKKLSQPIYKMKVEGTNIMVPARDGPDWPRTFTGLTPRGGSPPCWLLQATTSCSNP